MGLGVFTSRRLDAGQELPGLTGWHTDSLAEGYNYFNISVIERGRNKAKGGLTVRKRAVFGPLTLVNHACDACKTSVPYGKQESHVDWRYQNLEAAPRTQFRACTTIRAVKRHEQITIKL